jgi:DNA repair exonuclease SbcCD ATPase subunit
MIPVNIEIKNFFSHKASTVDFSQFNAALLIGNIEGNYDTSNGSGKSAIFEAVLWALFNKTRAAAMDDIIFWGENLCKVTFTFKHKSEIYKVIRTRSRITSTSTVALSVLDDNGVWADISGTTSGLTNSKICSTIKLDYKTFVNSAYFRQNDVSEFAESDAGTRKNILKSIIDISKWDEYEKSAKVKIRDLKTEMKIYSAGLKGYEESVILLENAKRDLKTSQRSLDNKTKNRDEVEGTINSLVIKYEEMKGSLDTDSWDSATSELLKDKESLRTLNKKIIGLKRLCNEYSDTIKKKSLQSKEYDVLILALKTDDKADEKISAANDKLITFKSNLSTSKELLSILNEREISQGQCYVCLQSIEDDLYDNLAKEHNEEKDKYEKTIIYCNNKIKEIVIKIKNLNILSSNNKKKLNYLSKIKSIRSELEMTKDRLHEMESDRDSINSKIKAINNNIEINQNLLESIRDDVFRDLQHRLNVLRKEKDNLIDSIGLDNRSVGVLLEKVSNLKSNITSMEVTRQELFEKQKKSVVFEKLAKLFGKNGIQTILLNAVIEDLEKTANDILVSICNEPFVIYLETQRVGSDGVSIVDTLDLKVKKDGIVQNFKSLSGGEQFRISLALRIALSEISSRHGGSSLEFLLLDEINSPLDRQGTESLFVNVIKALEEKYKILVITHNDALKEKFDNIIDVTKINGESQTSFISM